jgi:homoserine O-acetyltransferase
MLTFRTEASLEGRFGRQPASAGSASSFAVQGWLDRHGEKLNARFDPRAYATLLDAMDAHDVGRGRGGREAALRQLGRAVERLVAVGVPGDLLYSAEVVREWAGAAGVAYREVRSVHGHDAFLLEGAQVGTILREALDAVPGAVPDDRVGDATLAAVAA